MIGEIWYNGLRYFTIVLVIVVVVVLIVEVVI